MMDRAIQELLVLLIAALIWFALKPRITPPGSFLREGLAMGTALLLIVFDVTWFVFDGIVGR